MITEIKRIKALDAAAGVSDTDVIAVDQDSNGVRGATIAQIRSSIAASAQGLTCDALSPEGRISGRPGFWHHQVVDGATVRIYAKASGVDTTDGWQLIFGPPEG